jgi:hypothetical protein
MVRSREERQHTQKIEKYSKEYQTEQKTMRANDGQRGVRKSRLNMVVYMRERGYNLLQSWYSFRRESE